MEKEIIKIIAQNIGGYIPDQKECAKQIYQLFETRIKELEQTIENMKAIAGEKIEPVGCISSVYYPSDNETEVFKKITICENGNVTTITTNCCNNKVEEWQNYCPNCGRKIKK